MGMPIDSHERKLCISANLTNDILLKWQTLSAVCSTASESVDSVDEKTVQETDEHSQLLGTATSTEI